MGRDRPQGQDGTFVGVDARVTPRPARRDRTRGRSNVRDHAAPHRSGSRARSAALAFLPTFARVVSSRTGRPGGVRRVGHRAGPGVAHQRGAGGADTRDRRRMASAQEGARPSAGRPRVRAGHRPDAGARERARRRERVQRRRSCRPRRGSIRGSSPIGSSWSGQPPMRSSVWASGSTKVAAETSSTATTTRRVGLTRGGMAVGLGSRASPGARKGREGPRTLTADDRRDRTAQDLSFDVDGIVVSAGSSVSLTLIARDDVR